MGKNIMNREFVGKKELVIKYEGKTFGQDQYFVYLNGKQQGDSQHTYSEAQKLAKTVKEGLSNA